MTTTEEKLKKLILSRYHSVREFTIEADIPYSTLDSIFKRGIGNSSVTNVIKICKALRISVDALADGDIVSSLERARTPIDINDSIEIKDVLEDTKDILKHSGLITLDGRLVSKDEIEPLIDAIEVGVELTKRKTKL